jgi:hypothetical protein
MGVLCRRGCVMADKRQRAVRAYMRLTGLNYTRAAREMARYADPTHYDIVAQAQHLVKRLESMPRAHDAEFDALSTNRFLTLAVAAARDIAHGLRVVTSDGESSIEQIT